MKKTLLQVAASFSVSVGLMGGVAVAAPTISDTGTASYNKIKVTNRQRCELKNRNNVGVSNKTIQSAHTGNARVRNNNTGGSAASGAATNTGTTATGVTLNNTTDPSDCETTLPTDGSESRIDDTGRLSVNVIENKNTSKVKVVNSNNIGVHNMTVQSSSSGNAVVRGNTTGGDATSGDASNTSTTTTTINVTN